jgi:PAS domain-containing protein
MSMQGLIGCDDLLGTIFNAMPLPVFIVDDDVKIVAYNRTAASMLAVDPQVILRRRAGEVLHCVHAREAVEGCGRAPACGDCVVRSSVNTSFKDQKMVRQKVKMELVEEGKGSKEIFLLVTTAPFEYLGNGHVLLILQDVSELMELKRIVPICANCKKIRNDDQYWHSVEAYFKKHMDLDFSHGLCPDCMQKLYPEFCRETK